MTDIISMSATTTRPMVPAKESNIFNQYSPAPVVNINPMKKQNKHTAPEDNIGYYMYNFNFNSTSILNVTNTYQ